MFASLDASSRTSAKIRARLVCSASVEPRALKWHGQILGAGTSGSYDESQPSSLGRAAQNEDVRSRVGLAADGIPVARSWRALGHSAVPWA